MKKYDGQTAKVLEDIIKEQQFEYNGKQYKIVEMDDYNITRSTVEEDVKRDPKLKEKLLAAKKEIEEKKYYTSQEMRKMIRSGQI